MNGREVAGAWLEKASGGELIVVAGAGTGLSAKCSEAGGADAVVIYNSGRYRMAGRGSLAGLMPYGDANQIVLDMANEIVTVVADIPVVAGVCGTDPFRSIPRFLAELDEVGVSGIQNFPTVGLIDGNFRRALESTGMSYAAEVDLIGLARDRGLFTMPYVFDDSQASQMIGAGADVIVAHLGLTAGGMIGDTGPPSLEAGVSTLNQICDVTDGSGRTVPVLCHGGPIADPSDLGHVLKAVPRLAGFVGASSIERLATEEAIVERVRRFRAVRRG